MKNLLKMMNILFFWFNLAAISQKLVDFAVNHEVYKEIAETCCHRILISGSGEVDGIFSKANDIIHGKVVYKTDLGKIIYHDLDNFAIGDSGHIKFHVRSHLNSGNVTCPNMVTEWLEGMFSKNSVEFYFIINLIKFEKNKFNGEKIFMTENKICNLKIRTRF